MQDRNVWKAKAASHEGAPSPSKYESNLRGLLLVYNSSHWWLVAYRTVSARRSRSLDAVVRKSTPLRFNIERTIFSSPSRDGFILPTTIRCASTSVSSRASPVSAYSVQASLLCEALVET